MNSAYLKLKAYSERLEEEKSLVDHKKVQQSYHFHNQSSLHSELSILEHPEDSTQCQLEDSIEDIFFIKGSSPSISLQHTSANSYSKFFTTKTLNHIKIYPTKSSRKAPEEEYFLLTTQVIKMNSRHMENICSISGQLLYSKALKEEIPFHKWHE